MKTLRSFRGVFARRCRGFALGSFVLAGAVGEVPAAAVLNVNRSLMTVIDLLDFGPLAGDETFELAGDGTGLPAYARTVGTTNVANDNSGAGTARIDSAFDAAALRFTGSGGSSLAVTTRFDAADVASGAVLDGLAASSASFAFRLDRAGRLVLSGALAASGAGQRAWVRVEKYDGSGVALWSRQISTGSLEFSAEVPLATGNYIVLANAVGALDVTAAGAVDLAGAASWTLAAQAVEPPPAGGGKPGKPRK